MNIHWYEAAALVKSAWCGLVQVLPPTALHCTVYPRPAAVTQGTTHCQIRMLKLLDYVRVNQVIGFVLSWRPWTGRRFFRGGCDNSGRYLTVHCGCWHAAYVCNIMCVCGDSSCRSWLAPMVPVAPVCCDQMYPNRWGAVARTLPTVHSRQGLGETARYTATGGDQSVPGSLCTARLNLSREMLWPSDQGQDQAAASLPATSC